MTDPGSIEFRRFRAEDTNALRNLHVLALRSTGAFVETNNTRDWDRDLDDIETVYLRTGGEFLVGEIDDVIVAMGGVRLNDDGSATLKRMRVHPRFQRRGYGRELLRRLEEIARQKGVRRMVLDTLPVQSAALTLYVSSGYVETKRGERDDIELVFMEKSLT